MGDLPILSPAQVQETVRQLHDGMTILFPGEVMDVILYGSYARGDYDESSDLDFVALVKGERRNLQRKLDEVWNDTVKMDLEYDIVTSPTVIPVDEFQKYRDELPYY